MGPTMTLAEQYETTLDTVLGCYWSGPDGDGEYCATVDAGTDIDSVRRSLPGWGVRWAGVGNTDADGISTEDLYLTPPEEM